MSATCSDREKRGSPLCQGYRGREVSGKMCGESKGDAMGGIGVTGACAMWGGVLVKTAVKCTFMPRDSRFHLLSFTSCVFFCE